MNKFMKPVVIVPMIIGLVVGILLFMMGNADDAPGLSAIGLSIAFVLIMWGIYNAGTIKKGFLLPIYLFCFGVAGIVLSVVLLLDGEFEDSPGLVFIGVAIGIVLIVAGALRLRARR